MIFSITHRLDYTYSKEVFLEPHTLRLHPRCGVDQRIRAVSLSIDPQPEGRDDYLDPEGNCATTFWFGNETKSLTIETSMEVETLRMNPFRYLVTDTSFFQLPCRYPEQDLIALAPCLATGDPGEDVLSFSRAVVEQTGGQTLDFLFRLCTEINENFKVVVRHTGPPLAPAETLRERKGACRDLALLYMAACRCQGVAARFVSGYQEEADEMESHHLHAWVEVYIPGGGWRGYDPTQGLVVADRHVVLAASHRPESAAPVTGTFRGPDVSAEMTYRISVTTSP
ncbi:MAG: transglutaminase family protein [Desulfobulbaceae bacterium]